GDVEPATVFREPHRLEVLDALAAPDLAQYHVLFRVPFRRDQHEDRPADELRLAVAEDLLARLIAGVNDAVQVLRDDRVGGRRDDRRKPSLRSARLRSL